MPRVSQEEFAPWHWAQPPCAEQVLRGCYGPCWSGLWLLGEGKLHARGCCPWRLLCMGAGALCQGLQLPQGCCWLLLAGYMSRNPLQKLQGGCSSKHSQAPFAEDYIRVPPTRPGAVLPPSAGAVQGDQPH